MNCNDVSAILDAHRSTRLSAAERATVDSHLTGCEDCAAAWHAQVELLGLPVPRVPATLLERAMLAVRVPARAQPRRAWPSIAVGTALLAGAALASVTIVSLTRSPSVPVPSATDGEPSAQLDDTSAIAAPAAPRAAATEPQAATTTSVELVETALSILPIVRTGPDYPLEALKQRLSGHVQVKFDVNATGAVENVSVVESSDALFEASAVRAVSTWRYLPRIAAGKRVAASGIHTILRFVAPDDQQPASDRREVDAKQEAAQRDFAAFAADLVIALDRLAADDLRGAELQLDQMQAIHGANYPDLWTFYGYLFTVQGNFDRAIDSYATAVSTYARLGQPASGPWVPLANLYFARHQYDVALKTLVAYRDGVAAMRAGNPGLPARPLEGEAMRLVEQLRALGITDPSL